MGIPPILWFDIWAKKSCTSDWTAEKPQHGSKKINLKVYLFNLVNNELLSSWLGVSVAFAFVTVLLACFGELAVILHFGVFARVCVAVLSLLWGNFPCPLIQQFANTIYACAFTCACSFTVCSIWASWSVFLSFSVFFLPSSPFIIISNGIVVLISPLNLVQCDGCLGWGWVWRVGLVAELWVGKAFVVFLLPGLGVGSCSSQVPKKPTSMCNSGIN